MNKEEIVKKFKKIYPELAKKIVPLWENPAVVAAEAKQQWAKNELLKVENALTSARHVPISGPQAKLNVEEIAEKIYNGASMDDFIVDRAKDNRDRLIDEMLVYKQIIKIAECQVKKAKIEAMKKTQELISNDIKGLKKQRIKELKKFKELLERDIILSEYLKLFIFCEQGILPSGWGVHPIELALLSGSERGPMPVPKLDFIIKQKEEGLGI